MENDFGRKLDSAAAFFAPGTTIFGGRANVQWAPMETTSERASERVGRPKGVDTRAAACCCASAPFPPLTNGQRAYTPVDAAAANDAR